MTGAATAGLRSIRGTIHQTPTADRLEILEDHVITIDETGIIETVVPASRHEGSVDRTLGADQVLVPGMVDTHVHAPQWPQLGTGLDLPLERWLFDNTFPLEARFADPVFAQRVWDRMVPALLAHGTTTAAYYGSIHEGATAALAETCIRHGQRALVGRVAMDHPDATPDWYRDASASESVAASARSIEAVLTAAGGSELVGPIITPRFIPACSDAALTGLGELAEATGVLVQTHCSESDWEHAHVLERCGTTDTRALERFGLLRDRTVLAHATHLTSDDRALIAASGSGIAHCPLSNIYFADRPFAARAALDSGIRLGLGTDIAGGPSPSLMAQCGHAVGASQRLVDDGMGAARIGIVAAFWMATVGGADLLGVDAGLLVPGRYFDALAVSLHRSSDGPDELDDTPERRFERLVRLTGPADLVEVWVAGRSVVDDAPARWQI